MPIAIKVDEAYCRDCDEDEIYMDLKEEPRLYKVGAVCDGCDRDYGVLDRVSRSDIDHVDEAWEQAEDIVRQYMD
ncbi:hypothetical protein [Halomontanus rarus]|uniref:hypothetical protein n=1 Tax=Halomontanus rarus TaxID=3034020 RepID=UPI001A986EDD